MERIRLDIIPKGLMPVCHASQYDAGRVIRLDLMDGLQGYSLTNEEIELNVRKPDGHIVTASVDVVEGQTYVDIVTTEQMCAVEGENICELKISKDNAEIYSLNFRMMVEKSVTEGGDPSESFIHNLHTQIAEGVAEEVATQYDSANVIFDNEPTDNHGIGYTVTSEGIKTAIDNAFDYDNTASGSLVHITDGADNIPVKSLVSQITAVESGSGEKSPDNPYTISGFDSGIITRCGKNLFSNSDVRRGIYTNLDGSTTSGVVSTNFSSAFIKCKPSTTYIIEMFEQNYWQGSINAIYYGEGKQGLNDGTVLNNLTSNTPKTFTTPASAEYFVITGYRSTANGGTDIFTTAKLLITDSSDITYEAYNGNTYTFTFGQTVYGGHFDNKGNLVVTYALTDINTAITSRTTSYANPVFYGSINGLKPQSNNSLCEAFNTINGQASASNFAQNSNNHDFAINSVNSGDTIQVFVRADEYTDVASLKSACGNSKIKYELANPITLAITSQDIPTLLGENNIFSNTGDVDVTIRADIGLYIDKKISSLAQA